MAERRILLTRPRGRSEAFAAELAPSGWRATIWPLSEIRPCDATVSTADAQAAIYTSRAGVEHAPPGLTSLPAFCVGDATAAAARAAGHDQVASARGDVGALTALLLGRLAPGDGALLHLRGRDAAGDLSGALGRDGYEVREAIVYEALAARAAPLEIDAAIASGAFAAAAFFSPRASSIFAGLARDHWRKGLSVATAFAISENAAEPLRELGFGAVAIADAPNAGALRAAICGSAI